MKFYINGLTACANCECGSSIATTSLVFTIGRCGCGREVEWRVAPPGRAWQSGELIEYWNTENGKVVYTVEVKHNGSVKSFFPYEEAKGLDVA